MNTYSVIFTMMNGNRIVTTAKADSVCEVLDMTVANQGQYLEMHHEGKGIMLNRNNVLFVEAEETGDYHNFGDKTWRVTT